MRECKACGHKSGYDIEEDKWINERELFITVIGTFYTERQSNYGGIHQSRVDLIACPICKTVILDD